MTDHNTFASILTQFFWGVRDSLVGIRILFHTEPPDDVSRSTSHDSVAFKQVNSTAQQHGNSSSQQQNQSFKDSPPMSVLAQRRAQRKALDAASQKQENVQTVPRSGMSAHREVVIKPISDLAKIKNRLALCCVLNGGIFLVSIIIFDYMFMPLLEWCTLAVMHFDMTWTTASSSLSYQGAPEQSNDLAEEINTSAAIIGGDVVALLTDTAMSPQMVNNDTPHLLSNVSYFATQSTTTLDTASSWQYMSSVMRMTFSLFWLWPVFLLSRLVNTLWFQDVADATYFYLQKQRGGAAVTASQRYPLVPASALQRSSQMKVLGISQLIADIIFSTLVLAFFLVQASLALLIPIQQLALITSYVHLCLLYALYAFEYKWLKDGIDVRNRIGRVETFWPYFAGFGAPVAILTSLTSSYLVAGGLFAIVFPLFIVSASDAEAPDFVLLHYYNTGTSNSDITHVDNGASSTSRRSGRFFVTKIPLFAPSVMLANWIFTKFSNSAVQRQQRVLPVPGTSRSPPQLSASR